MKLRIIILVLSCIIILSGCTNYKKETELLEQQNTLLQKEVDLNKESNKTVQNVNENNDPLFDKKVECAKHQKDIENKFNNETSVSLFYSPFENTCVYESIGIINGQIQSRIIADVFGSGAYVLEQNGKLTYDEKVFGINKSYLDIEKILKGK